MITVNGQTLHPIKGYNTYCGPAVMAALFGITTDQAAEEVRKRNRFRKQVRGIYTHELLNIIAEFNWTAIKMPPYSRSVKTLLKVPKSDYPTGIYLLNVTGHFILAFKSAPATEWMCVDNQKKTPVPLVTHTRYATKRIDGMYLLLPPRVSQPAASEQPVARAADTGERGPESLRELFRI